MQTEHRKGAKQRNFKKYKEKKNERERERKAAGGPRPQNKTRPDQSLIKQLISRIKQKLSAEITETPP